MGTGTHSEVLITVPLNPPLSQSRVSTASNDLSGRKSDWSKVSVLQQNTHFHFGVFEYSCNDNRRRKKQDTYQCPSFVTNSSKTHLADEK